MNSRIFEEDFSNNIEQILFDGCKPVFLICNKKPIKSKNVNVIFHRDNIFIYYDIISGEKKCMILCDNIIDFVLNINYEISDAITILINNFEYIIFKDFDNNLHYLRLGNEIKGIEKLNKINNVKSFHFIQLFNILVILNYDKILTFYDLSGNRFGNEIHNIKNVLEINFSNLYILYFEDRISLLDVNHFKIHREFVGLNCDYFFNHIELDFKNFIIIFILINDEVFKIKVDKSGNMIKKSKIFKNVIDYNDHTMKCIEGNDIVFNSISCGCYYVEQCDEDLRYKPYRRQLKSAMN